MEIEYIKKPVFSWVIFLACLSIVFIAETTVVFPALIIKSTSGIENYANIDPFETGIWAYPFLVTNFVLLGIGILYFKNKIPNTIKKSIRFILNFEISREVAFLVFVVLLGFFLIISVHNFFTEEPWGDYYRSKSEIEKWTPTDIPHVLFQFGWFLLYTSMKVFGSYKVLPFISSAALLILTYLLTKEISKKRFAGIVAMVIVLQSGIFRNYDTSIIYTDFWVMFYVLSLYMVCKKWPVSPLSFIFSFLSKGIASVFLPMTFFFIYREQITRQKKIFLAISYGAILTLGVTLYQFYAQFVPGFNSFSSYGFWRAINSISYQLRNDGLVLLFLPILIVGLFIASRRGVRHADSVMILVAGALLSQSVLEGFTQVFSEIYRFMPLIIFFAVGVGTALSKKIS